MSEITLTVADVPYREECVIDLVSDQKHFAEVYLEGNVAFIEISCKNNVSSKPRWIFMLDQVISALEDARTRIHVTGGGENRPADVQAREAIDE
jgi:hypothetical protein